MSPQGRALSILRDGQYHQLSEFEKAMPDRHDVTRRIRDLRKPEFGQYTIDATLRKGWYRIVPDPPDYILGQVQQAARQSLEKESTA